MRVSTQTYTVSFKKKKTVAKSCDLEKILSPYFSPWESNILFIFQYRQLLVDKNQAEQAKQHVPMYVAFVEV